MKNPNDPIGNRTRAGSAVPENTAPPLISLLWVVILQF